jgi:hypothetical protein
MPTVAIVRGILILFYANDHEPPHFHAEGPDFSLRIAIDNGTIMDQLGKVSAGTRRILIDWTTEHREQLMENWRLARSQQPLKRIEG